MGQFDEAIEDAAEAEAEATKERDREITSMMRGFEENLMRARIEGTDTRSAERLFERARDFFRAKKYRQAIATAQQSEAEAERVGLQQAMARQAVETVERKLRSMGNGSSEVARPVSDARKMFDEADFVRALDTAGRRSASITDPRTSRARSAGGPGRGD